MGALVMLVDKALKNDTCFTTPYVFLMGFELVLEVIFFTVFNLQLSNLQKPLANLKTNDPGALEYIY